MENSFTVGSGYLIQTATLYYAGEVVRETFSHVYLKTASWVHWTGRFGTLLRLARSGKSFNSAFPTGETRPRTEYLGEYRVWKQSIVGDGEVPVASLPKESIR